MPDLEKTKQTMAALVRMKPKPHEKMKIGKKADKAAPSHPARKRGASKPKNV